MLNIANNIKIYAPILIPYLAIVANIANTDSIDNRYKIMPIAMSHTMSLISSFICLLTNSSPCIARCIKI